MIRCGRIAKSTGKPCQHPCAVAAFSDPERWQPPACVPHLTATEKEQYAASQARAAEYQRTWPQRYEAMLVELDRERAAAEDDGLPLNACRRGPCGNHRMPWNHGTGLPDPKVCREHLTAEELAAFVKAEADLRERTERLKHEPDCWSWPVPAPREYATDEEASAALHEWQLDHGCAICGPSFDLVEDHDHETGLVRGNLCRSCNTKEGWGAESLPFVKYRQRPPAAIIGVKVRYWSPFHGYNTELPPPTEEDMRHARAVLEARSLPRPEDITRTETTS